MLELVTDSGSCNDNNRIDRWGCYCRIKSIFIQTSGMKELVEKTLMKVARVMTFYWMWIVLAVFNAAALWACACDQSIVIIFS